MLAYQIQAFHAGHVNSVVKKINNIKSYQLVIFLIINCLTLNFISFLRNGDEIMFITRLSWEQLRRIN